MLTQRQRDSFTFVDLDAEPVPSLLRGFSAPVMLDYDYSDAQLLTLLAQRHRPVQPLGSRPAPGAARRDPASSRTPASAGRARRSTTPSSTPCAACCAIPTLDAAFKELVLTLPSETYIAEQLDVVDPQRIHAVREAMRAQLAHGAARRLGMGLRGSTRTPAPTRPIPCPSGRRALAGLALTHLCLAARATRRHGVAGQDACSASRTRAT